MEGLDFILVLVKIMVFHFVAFLPVMNPIGNSIDVSDLILVG